MPLDGKPQKHSPLPHWTRIITDRSSDEFSSMYVHLSANQDMISSTYHLGADEHLRLFNANCSNILNSIAPLKVKNKQNSVPWQNDFTRSLRQTCRRAERKWKKDKLQVLYDIFRDSISAYQRAVKAAKCNDLSELILRNSHKPNIFFPRLNLFFTQMLICFLRHLSLFVRTLQDILIRFLKLHL